MLELGKREYFWEKSCRIYIIFHSNESSQNPLGPSPTSTHAFDILLQESQQKHCQAATCEHVHVQSLIPSVWWKTKRDGDSFAVSATGCEKKKKSQNHKNHKIQTAAHWLNYVNHSPKRSRWSILVWNPIRTHTFLKNSNNTTLAFKLKAASNSFYEEMVASGSSLYCFQANEISIKTKKFTVPIACRNHGLLLPTHTMGGFKSKCPNSFHFCLRRN